MEIQNWLYSLQMNIKATRENDKMIFVYIFAMYLFTQKDSINGMPENIASRKILTKMEASIFHRI